MNKKLLAIAVMGWTGLCLAAASAQQPPAQPAPAGPGRGQGGQAGQPPRVYPVTHDMTGKWVAHTETAGRDGTINKRDITMILIQTGNEVVGASEKPPLGSPPPQGNVPSPTMPIFIYGWNEGDQTTLQSDFAFDGGEHFRWILNYKDGHWVGTRVGTHDAPHKYRLDTNINVDYQKVE